jgi:hypothetical protein
VLYDVTDDDDDNFLFNYLKTRPVKISLIKGRATYGDFFKIANEKYPSSKIIVTNADIFFNETLWALKDYDLTNKFLALTRWDVLADGSLKMRRDRDSQDTWIFSTPLKKFKNDNVMLGVVGCDPEIAYHAHESGLRVINPCLTIRCCHLHLSNIRNYVYDPKTRPYKKELKPLPLFSKL